MSSLTAIRDAAVDFLRQANPGLIRVEAFSGEISLDAVSVKTLPPGASLLVAALGAENDAETGSLDLDILGSFSALAVSNNIVSAEARDAQALAVAESVVPAIHGCRFGLANVGPAIVKSLETIRDAELDAIGIGVWAVIWQQTFTVSPAEEARP